MGYKYKYRDMCKTSVEGIVEETLVAVCEPMKDINSYLVLQGNPEHFQMKKIAVRVDIGESVRIFYDPRPTNEGPKTICALEVLDENKKPKFVYASSTYFLEFKR